MYAGIRSLVGSPNTSCTQLGWIGCYKDLNGEEHHCDLLSNESRFNIVKKLEEYNAVPVFISKEDANGHYEGYSKHILWPLLHYMSWNDAHPMHPAWWKSYVKVNKTFATTISTIYKNGDIVWAHDYHLLLLPEMFRNMHPTATIGFFLHSPFPSSEIFRSLPHRKDILYGMLGSTSIGFQTYSYARHFLSSCTRVLGLESTPTGIDNKGSLVSVGVFPIGIDAKSVQERRALPSVKTKMKSLREMFANKRIIIGRDRLDEVAGIKQKLEAFEKFLELYPQYQNNVVLIQVTQPGQMRQPKLEAKISELVTSINSNYGSLEFMPVLYHHSFLDTDEYMALLNIADLCLITVIRDGMNTGSLEYVVCQQDKHSPLILSEFTGTAGSVSGAIQINPWDYESVAQAIDTAFRMSPEDKTARYKEMHNHVMTHDAQYWASAFIDDLRATVLAGQTNTETPSLDFGLIKKEFAAAKKRLVMLDYDGTLTPITNIPAQALPPSEMLSALHKLCADPRNFVCVISGRDRQFLELHLGGIKGLALSGEHGSFIRYPGGDWLNLLAEMDMGWKEEVMSIFEFFTERTAGSTIEAKETSITWHYRNADPEYGEFQAKECMNHLENSVVSKRPVEILVGKKCLEVRPISVNKGEIVKRLLGTHPDQWDFVACAGDDKTDEDMFRALRTMQRSDYPHYFTITVGPSDKKSAAAWHVTSSHKVVEALIELASTE
ncbi:glycosyltransferase family 20-domain-containing protein [Coemansia spiralis]|nr:glycosyltransferase family 20-domain-containing protein [Coemansia spiralis]